MNSVLNLIVAFRIRCDASLLFCLLDCALGLLDVAPKIPGLSQASDCRCTLTMTEATGILVQIQPRRNPAVSAFEPRCLQRTSLSTDMEPTCAERLAPAPSHSFPPRISNIVSISCWTHTSFSQPARTTFGACSGSLVTGGTC